MTLYLGGNETIPSVSIIQARDNPVWQNCLGQRQLKSEPSVLLEGEFLSAQGHRAPIAPPQATTPLSLARSPAPADAQPGPAAAHSPGISPENLLESRGSPISGELFPLVPASLVRVQPLQPGAVWDKNAPSSGEPLARQQAEGWDLDWGWARGANGAGGHEGSRGSPDRALRMPPRTLHPRSEHWKQSLSAGPRVAESEPWAKGCAQHPTPPPKPCEEWDTQPLFFEPHSTSSPSLSRLLLMG